MRVCVCVSELYVLDVARFVAHNEKKKWKMRWIKYEKYYPKCAQHGKHFKEIVLNTRCCCEWKSPSACLSPLALPSKSLLSRCRFGRRSGSCIFFFLCFYISLWSLLVYTLYWTTRNVLEWVVLFLSVVAQRVSVSCVEIVFLSLSRATSTFPQHFLLSAVLRLPYIFWQ